LRSLGHSVIEGIKILKRPGLSDKKHLVASIKQSAILLAFDRDFKINPDLKEMIKKSLGVILVEATDTRTETAQKILKKVLKIMKTKNTLKGKICCASIDKISFP
jgi:hypothetical protein